MLAVLADHWGLLLFRGVVSILFGLAAFVWPGITLVALVVLFGAFALLVGVAALIVAISARGSRGFASLMFEAIFGIAAGVVTFFYPGISAIVLLAVIAAWAILTGVAAIAAAIALRKELTGEWMLALYGALSVVFGLMIVLRPAAGALAVVWLIGAYAMLAGAIHVALAVRLREVSRGTLRPV
jgi:uncharacterized membrane protein HdeD (DUF308 family)